MHSNCDDLYDKPNEIADFFVNTNKGRISNNNWPLWLVNKIHSEIILREQNTTIENTTIENMRMYLNLDQNEIEFKNIKFSYQIKYNACADLSRLFMFNKMMQLYVEQK